MLTLTSPVCPQCADPVDAVATLYPTGSAPQHVAQPCGHRLEQQDANANGLSWTSRS